MHPIVISPLSTLDVDPDLQRVMTEVNSLYPLSRSPSAAPPSASIPSDSALPLAQVLAAEVAANNAAWLAETLARFHLRVNEDPRLLICTRCTQGMPLIPTFDAVSAHIRNTHRHPLAESGTQALRELLEALNLVHPKDLSIDPDRLPARAIKELQVLKGRRCKLCSYAIASRPALSAHVKKNHADKMGPGDEGGIFVSIQLIHQCGQRKRFLHVYNDKLDSTPEPLLPEAALTTAEPTEAIKSKVHSFLTKNKAACLKAGVLKAGVLPTDSDGHSSRWAKMLNWTKYWADKNVAAIGALKLDAREWPGAHGAFVAWLVAAAKTAVRQWTKAFDQIPRVLCQMFKKYSDDAAHPYTISDKTSKKRADIWAHALGLLAHIVYDGTARGYLTDDQEENHLACSDDIFKWLLKLKEFWNTEVASLDLDDEQLARVQDSAAELLLGLSVSLIQQVPKQYGYSNRLTLSRLFLHLCVHRDGTLIPVGSATSIIVSLEYDLRAILHQYLLDPCDGILLDVEQDKHHSEIAEHIRRYAYASSDSASAYLQSIHVSAKPLAEDETTSTLVSWSHDLSMVQIGEQQIQISRLQNLMKGAHEQASKLLRQLCLLPSDAALDLQLKNVRDDHRRQTPDFNFAVATPELPNVTTILERVAAGDVPAERPLVDTYGGEIEFDNKAAQAYFSAHDDFTRLLMILIELSSGLPARGTELAQLQHTNTLIGARNIFVFDGSVFTVLPSDKGTGRQKLIPRFLPHSIGCLVVHYVSQVVPFVHVLFNAVHEPRAVSSLLLVDHSGRSLDTNALSKTLQALCRQHVSSTSEGLTMRSWRQLACSIDRTLIRTIAATEEDSKDNAHDLQAGHSTSTAQRHYGLDASMLQQLTQESMTKMLGVSERWHIFWKLATRYQEPPKAYSSLATTENGDGGTVQVKAIELLKRQLDSVQDEVRSVKSKLDHHSPLRAAPVLGSLLSAGASRSAALPAPVLDSLHKVTNSWTTATLEQAYALNAIHARESPLIVVMATGAGKSALFMAPLPWLPPASIVVVIVPFVALMAETLDSCRRADIKAGKWVGYQCAKKLQNSRLVFVPVEQCAKDAFLTWVREIKAAHLLAAVFFDECHVALTQSNFRSSMDSVKLLLDAARVPQYFLTATLPPSMLASFKLKLGLPADGTGIIRASTNRKNISYAVQHLPSPSNDQSLYPCLEALLAAHPSGAVMIFCMSTKSVESIADWLRCASYTSVTDESVKQAVLAAWLLCSSTETDNRKRILVGTTAIGTGINPQHVSLVIHCNDTWDMVSYVQESGRAGRSGAPASAVLLATHNHARAVDLQQYIDAAICRRLAISTYMDGRPITCHSEPDLALCDLCKLVCSSKPVTSSSGVPTPELPPQPSMHIAVGCRAAGAPCDLASSSHLPPQASTSRLVLSTQDSFDVLADDVDFGYIHTPDIARLSAKEAAKKSKSTLAPAAGHAFQPSSAFPRVLSRSTSAPDVSLWNYVPLLELLRDRCSLCYLLRAYHRCPDSPSSSQGSNARLTQQGLEMPRSSHSFFNCQCWLTLDMQFPGGAGSNTKINGSLMGTLRRMMNKEMGKVSGVTCWSCFAPLELCRTAGGGSNECNKRYKDIVLPVVAASLQNTDLCRRACSNIGIPFESLDSIRDRLGTTVDYKGGQALVAFALFIEALSSEW